MTAKKKPVVVRPWSVRLDEAVMARWPEVQCDTGLNIFSMRMVTTWCFANTENKQLTPALARQVKAFVAGFMASEEAHL